MDWKEIFFQVFGGLGLFLMGMKVMSEGMQKVAGDGLKRLLNILTANRFIAVFVGFLVTAIIQSSSATTVMTVGFVNAGLMKLPQAIGIVLGANIGTTVTGWIVSLPIVKYALPFIGVGVGLRFFSKNQKWRYIGEITFGFGILFLGMTTMKNGFKPLRSSQEFIDLFMLVDGHSYIYLILGVLVGAVTTVIVQSSSATIGITIALASQGLLNFEGAASLVLGENIGTTITAILASIGANHHAKRAALAHTMFNTLGVVVVLVLFYPFSALIESLVPGMADLTVKTAEQASKYGMEIGAKPYIAQHIAMFHSVFNITNVIVFVPLVGFLAKVVSKIIPEPKTKQRKGAFQFSHIHYGLIDTPSIGIAESEKELIAMANRVKKNDARVMALLNEERSVTDVFKKVERNEDLIDEYRNMITEFLLSLSQRSLSERDSNIVGNYITAAANLEKYADYLFNIAVQYKKFQDSGLKLSDRGKENLTSAVGQISDYFRDVTTSLEEEITEPEKFLKGNENRKVEIKKFIRKAKVSHFERLKEGQCQGDASMAYIEMLTNLDGMASQVYNIAEIGAGTKFGL